MSKRSGLPKTSVSIAASTVSREPLPILVGLTGKRNLIGRDDSVRLSLRRMFDAIDAAFPSAPKVLVCGLADGADSIAVEAALERAPWRVLGLLAYDEANFIKGLGDEAAQLKFKHFVAAPRVRRVTLAPLEAPVAGATPTGGAYEQLGLWLAENSSILIAVMPGDEQRGRTGGTARVVAHRLGEDPDDVAADVLAKSREVAPHAPLDRPPPQPLWVLNLTGKVDAEGVLPLSFRNARGDRELDISPRSMRTELITCAAIDAYNRRVGAPMLPTWPLAEPSADQLLAAFRASLSHVQQGKQAAWRRSVQALAALFVAAVLLLETFAKFGVGWAAPGYAALVLVGILLFGAASHRRWQNIHEDYRAVNEVLRIQRAWWAAGIWGAAASTQRACLQGATGALLGVRRGTTAMLAWIRLAAAQPQEDWSRVTGEKGWIAEQKRYFERRVHERERALERVRVMSWTLFYLAFGLALWLAVYGLNRGAELSHLAKVVAPQFGWLLGAMAMIVLVLWAWQRYRPPAKRLHVLALAGLAVPFGGAGLGSFAYSVGPALDADGKEVVVVLLVGLLTLAGAIRFVTEKLVWEAEANAYTQAERRFAEAQRLLRRSGMSPQERLTVLRALGEAALAENEAWFRAHRERPTEPVIGG